MESSTVRAEIVNMSVKDIQDDRVDMDVDVEVENPNSEAVQLVDIEFLLESGANDGQGEVVIKHVQHSCSIAPQTSQIIKVPVEFVYKNETGPSEMKSGQAGSIIPVTVRGRVNCFEAFKGMFQISLGKLKKFLPVDKKQLLPQKKPKVTVSSAHFTTISPDEVRVTVEGTLENENPLPIKLLYTTVSVETEGHVLVDAQRLDHNMLVIGLMSRKFSVPFMVPLKQLALEGRVKPGTVVPYKMTLDFWFREFTIGVENVGELPVPARAVTKIEAVKFGVDENTQRRTAKMCVRIENSNQFPVEVTKVDIQVKNAVDGHLVACAAMDGGPIPMEGSASHSIWMTVVPVVGLDAAVIGSALWDVYTGNYSRHLVTTVVEAETTKFGKILVT